MIDARNEFRASEIVDLLSELDKRLKARGAFRAERLLANSRADATPAAAADRADTSAVRRLDRPPSRERS
ncbi:hypothetical protein [Kribbella sp. VKM Ac-2566]|uniref:hypothetical protein n=1 Tax=Kribbella sp. VKM Ac-2566 TaxID=2512218 RepID=UPI001062538B|nr:hypothetical protein [Kribbella sp. VKM Ac-2566]